jgi:hypothetical protein
VIPITIGSILEADARRAGYESRQALVEELNEQTDGKLYRIEIGALEADPRIALRKSVPDSDGLDALAARLGRLDAHAGGKPWTVNVLEQSLLIPLCVPEICAAWSGRKRWCSS